MKSMAVVPESDYFQDEQVIGAVEVLNSSGLDGIIESARIISEGTDSTPPIRIVNPVDRSQRYRPLASFENGAVIRSPGMANGFRVDGQLVLSALTAQITGRPVIDIAFPDREWAPNDIPDLTSGWLKANIAGRRSMSVSQLDVYADSAMRGISEVLDRSRQGKVVFSGESMGAAMSLALANSANANNLDRGRISISALPNGEDRALYRELLVRDFAKSAEGFREQVTSGEPQLAPFVRAQNMHIDSKGAVREAIDGLEFLWRDLFGRFPANPRSAVFRANRPLARSLSAASGLQMLERLEVGSRDASTTSVAYFSDDLVARPDSMRQLGSSGTSLRNTDFYLFEGMNHTAANNPYVIGFMATKLCTE